MTGKDLSTMQAEVVAYCTEKGWAGPGSVPKTFGDCMALLHSEVSEALEAFRDHGLEDATAAITFSDSGRVTRILPKPEGVGSEFADVLIRLLDDCARYGIDLVFEYERKMAYNLTRAYQHGGKAL
jgi:NTP pyrophosphatase (non-canonical NTP hydrolase)